MSAEFYREYVENNRAIISRICRAYAETEDDFEDYFQEVCYQLWKARDTFDGSSQLSTWIYRVTLNVCLSLVRSKRNKPQRVELKAHHQVHNPEAQSEQDHRVEVLYRSIRQLKAADRALILLYLEEKNYQEIAEILGISVSNVGVKINRIKKRLIPIFHGKS